MPLPPKTLPHTYAHAHAHALLRKDTHNKTLRTDAQTLGPQNCPAHLAPHTFSGAREGVLVAVQASHRGHTFTLGVGLEGIT